MKSHRPETTASRNVRIHRGVWFVLLCAPLAAACFQEVDTAATRGTMETVNAPPPPTDPVTTTWKADDPIGTLGDGTTTVTQDACALTDAQARDILTNSCGNCHTPGHYGSGVIDFDILDLAALKTGVAVGGLFMGQNVRYLVPGDPDKSLIYTRIALTKDMPKYPTDPSGIPARLLTISDMSLINGWIRFCVGTDPVPAQ